jgi:hypothetical protein
MSTIARVQSPVRYSFSTARNLSTSGSGCSGSGNQNMLVASARRVSAMPLTLRLYAK